MNIIIKMIIRNKFLQTVLKVIEENAKNLDSEFRRLFHGRGKCFSGFEDIIIDSIDTTLLVQSYKEIGYKEELLGALLEFMQNSRHKNLIYKSRYDNKLEVISGELEESLFAIEDGIKYSLDLSNQNIGYFGDMRNGRAYVKSIAKDKRVLNLFAYTCGFSLAAKSGGAKEVINVDMSKGVLAVGNRNHAINGLNSSVKFWKLNILKSFPKIERAAAFDIVVIDPPTFQRGSFSVEEDYAKIVKRLPKIVAKGGIVVSALNAPYLDYNFLNSIYSDFTNFTKIKELEQVKEYCNKNPKEGLKIAIYRNGEELNLN